VKENGMDKCETHDEIVRSQGAIEEAVMTLKEDNSKIFDLLNGVRVDLTEALTKAQIRADTIAAIDRKIENGLKTSMANLTEQVRLLFVCSDHRKKERALEKTQGVGGFMRVGWNKFKSQLSFIIICTIFVLIVWSAAWILQKATLFHEMPWGLLKLLGIGG
jgi:hypothetical protein